MLSNLAQSAPAHPKPTVESEGEELSGLDLTLFQPALAIRDWLLEVGARDEKQNTLLSGLAAKLNRLGVPVERLTTAIEALHSEYAGVGRMWTREQGSSVRRFPHEERDLVYERSPFARVHATGEWLLLDLAETPDDAFG